MIEEFNTAYLSIGSNKGRKKENLIQAIDALNIHDSIEVTAVSRFYRTAPQNYEDQDWFVNGAVKIKTSCSPADLLIELKKIEKKLDKEGKAFRFGPRKIDLDIIYFGKSVLKTKTLEIPHPRMQERCFVLRPLCDIGRDAVHPVLKESPGELLKKIEVEENQEVILLEEEDCEIFY